jgi:hypothetical protein
VTGHEASSSLMPAGVALSVCLSNFFSECSNVPQLSELSQALFIPKRCAQKRTRKSSVTAMAYLNIGAVATVSLRDLVLEWERSWCASPQRGTVPGRINTSYAPRGL